MQKQQLIMSIVSIFIFIGIIGGISLIFRDDEPENVHVHRFSTVVEVTDCTEGGTSTKYCTECGYQKVTKVSPTKHSFVVGGSQEATCTEPGFTDSIKCSNCEYIEATTFTEPLGHDWGEESCTRCGLPTSTYELTGTWKFNNKIKKYIEGKDLQCNFEFYVNGVWYNLMYVDDMYVYIINDDTVTIPVVYKFDTDKLDEELSTIQIKGAQFVGEEFYNWFTQNAKKIN